MPRDGLSVPVARKLLAQSLSTLGVLPEMVDDVGLALTEACTNVLEHAAPGDAYDVSAGIDGNCVVIEVAHRGPGFDGSLCGLTEAAPDAEGGRGIQLMRALVDRLSFVQQDEHGSAVRLEKDLRWSPDSPLACWNDPQHGAYAAG